MASSETSLLPLNWCAAPQHCIRPFYMLRGRNGFPWWRVGSTDREETYNNKWVTKPSGRVKRVDKAVYRRATVTQSRGRLQPLLPDTAADSLSPPSVPTPMALLSCIVGSSFVARSVLKQMVVK